MQSMSLAAKKDLLQKKLIFWAIYLFFY